MHILITGGLGFIGGRLARHLQQAGHRITVGSRNPGRRTDWLPHAEVVETKWNDGRALEKICHEVDVVVHAAGMNARDCAANPAAALEFNAVATARLIEAAGRMRVKRFIYLSTAHVYADPLVGTITEDTSPRNPHPYATSHLAGEGAVGSASRRGKIEGTVLRLSNVFGAPAHKDADCWNLLVNDLCRQAVEHQKLVLRSSGLQQRDFIAMDEVCRVVAYLCPRIFDVPLPDVLNVGSGVSQSVLEMAQMVQQRCKPVLGFEPELQRSGERGGERHEMLVYRPDRLAALGISVSHDHGFEIDRLLLFCQASFAQSRSDGA